MNKVREPWRMLKECAFHVVTERVDEEKESGWTFRLAHFRVGCDVCRKVDLTGSGPIPTAEPERGEISGQGAGWGKICCGVV